MAFVCKFSTALGAAAFFSLHRALMGFPRAGAHVGGGVHVPMPDADPGLAGNSLGWTVRHRRMRRRLLDNVYGWVVDGTFQAAAADPTARARLSGAQRTSLDNNLATAAEDATYDDPALYAEEDTT
jgi:hypothetical protein